MCYRNRRVLGSFVIGPLLFLWACGNDGAHDGLDRTPPIVLSISPSHNADNVSPNSYVRIKFSEPIDETTINNQTIVVKADGMAVEGPGVDSLWDLGDLAPTVAVFSKAIPPDCGLLPDTLYTVRVTTGIRDLAGNSLRQTLSFSFHTAAVPLDTTPPMVVSVDPADQEGGVSINRPIVLTFSEPMDHESFSLEAGILTVHSEEAAIATRLQGVGTMSDLSSCQPSTATVLPLDFFEPATTYTVTTTAGPTDLAGNPLTGGHSWTFTTDSDPLIRATGLVFEDLSANDGFHILADDQRDYRPTNLPIEFAQDFTEVQFSALLRQDLIPELRPIPMWYPIDLVDIRSLRP